MQPCNLCRLGLQEKLRSNCIPGRGDVPADVMLVGQAPGRIEDEQGYPFVGPVGQKLDECKRKSGIDQLRHFTTNACRCFPPGDRAPKTDEITACLPYLLKEIEIVNPRIIVLMGNVALKGLLGKGYRTVTKERGEVYDWNGHKVLITLHPSNFLPGKSPEDEPVFISDLRLIHKILSGEPIVEGKRDYRVIRDLPSLRALAERLCSAKKFSFDLETTAFDWHDEEILCVGFSDFPGTAFVVPLLGQHYSKIWLDEQLPEVHALLRKILTSDTPKKGGQNYKYDLKFLKYKLGIEVSNLSFDTSLRYKLIDENLPNNLEFLSSYYLGLPRHDKEVRSIVTSKAISFSIIPDKTLWKYNATDVDVTLRLEEKGQELSTPGLERLMERICIPFSRTLMEMEMCGAYIDQGKLQENSERYSRLIGEEARKIFDLVGHEFKLSSPQQLGKVLFEELGLPPTQLTEAENWTTNKEALEELAQHLRTGSEVPEEKLVILDNIVRYRNLQHWKTTFIDGRDGTKGLKRWIKPDSRIYPNYLQDGTDMGRTACREPNLQNIPRDQELRNQFGAPPGWRHLHADYSQAEARAGAIVAKCKGLIAAMQAGLNIHRNAASKLRKIPYDAVTKEQYETIKFVTHGLHYGRSIPSIAAEYNLSLKEVAEFVEGYFQEYPELAELMLSQVGKVMSGEPIVNRFGRVRHFPDVIGGHERRVAISVAFAMNWADAMNLGTIRVYERLVKEGVWLKFVKMTMTLHDALFFEAREDKLDLIVPMIIEEMERPVEELDNYGFPIELEVGKCWEDPDLVVVWKGK